uniref:Uncharacterized protein n=1 Tax=Cucumis melo TaxID=3656 RepID=A0A9I9E7H5_CUCME
MCSNAKLIKFYMVMQTRCIGLRGSCLRSLVLSGVFSVKKQRKTWEKNLTFIGMLIHHKTLKTDSTIGKGSNKILKNNSQEKSSKGFNLQRQTTLLPILKSKFSTQGGDHQQIEGVKDTNSPNPTSKP